MAKQFVFTTEYRYHLLLGLVLSVWLYVFLVLVGPFDAQEVSLKIRTILMVGYGVVFFLSYAIFIPIQNKVYQLSGKWKFGHEVVFVLVFCLVVLPLCYVYYKTDLVNGTYTFSQFASGIYLPTIAILVPVIFGGRYLVARYGAEEEREGFQSPLLTLRGDHKHDILKVTLDQLVGIEAANNYVEVHYLVEGKAQKKLLRTTLSKVRKSIPELVQVHRSYLVNMDHFVEWKNSSTILMHQLEVPVSKKYKSSLLEMPTFAPK